MEEGFFLHRMDEFKNPSLAAAVFQRDNNAVFCVECSFQLLYVCTVYSSCRHESVGLSDDLLLAVNPG